MRLWFNERLEAAFSKLTVVLFTLPDSLPRLEEMDRAGTKIGFAGARVIAVPMAAS